MSRDLKIALVFGEYNHPVQPYLTSWAQGLEERLRVSIYSISPLQKDPQARAEHLSPHGRLEKAHRGLKLLVEHPAQTLSWLASPAGGTLLKRLNNWVVWGSLIAARPSIIHVVNSPIYPRLKPAIEHSQARCVVSFRGHDTVVRPLADENWICTLQEMYADADCLHFVSRYLQDEAVRLGAAPEKCRVIYPGVDTSFFTPAASGERHFGAGQLRLLTTGRLTWQKGYLVMLQAVKRLKSDGEALKYTIIGDGPDHEELTYWVRELGLQDSVELLGQKTPEAVRSLLRATDIYIQPSISEALGVSILEALAVCKPVIASRVGGIPEVIVEGETGRLVAPGDPEALAEAILELWQDEAQARRLAANGRALVEDQFTLAGEIQSWLELYGEL